jgi:uncharacterized membrane protein (UPF0127 family)
VKNANPVFISFMGNLVIIDASLRRKILALVVIGLVGLGLSGCKAGQTPTEVPPVLKSVNDHFDILVGNKTVHMQLAILPSECEHGLMQRPHLNKDEGMIFLFDQPQQMQFWMHNTEIPLNIGYFTPDGVLAEIYSMYAFDERTVASFNKHLQLALEMAENWYTDSGVTVGDRIDIQALARAVKDRGFKPEVYGLPKQ